MALRKRNGNRFENNVWAGFVDAMTALLLVMIFILSIFMVAQMFLRNTIIGQKNELDELSGRIAIITETLGGVRTERDALADTVKTTEDKLTALQFQFDAQTSAIENFEEDFK